MIAKPSSSMHSDYKPKVINDAFDGNYFEYKYETDEKSSITKYLEKIRPHIHDLINHLKKFVEWKMLLTMKPKLISLTASNEEHTMRSKSGSSINMIGSNTDEINQRLHFRDNLLMS